MRHDAPHDPVDAAVRLHDAAVARQRDGESAAAVAPCRRALALLEEASGPAHPDVANVLLTLGELHEDLADYAEAETCYARAESITRALPLGHDDLVRLRVQSLTHVGGIRRIRGSLEEAEVLLRDALEVAERHLGDEDPEVAVVCNALGMVCKFAGWFEQGEALYSRALALTDEADAASIFHNLGGLEHARGRYSAGEPYARRAVDLRERALAPDHPVVALDVAALAALVDGQGRHDEAEALYLRAAAVFERTYGPDHYELGVTAHNLGVLYGTTGDVARALRCYERAVAIKERVLGRGHADVAMSLHNLAGLHAREGRYQHARAAFAEALRVFESTLPQGHPHTAACRDELDRLRRPAPASVT